MKTSLRRIRCNKGTAALEFGLIGLGFAMLFVGVAELAFLLYAQTALDYAAKQSARLLQTGQITVAAGTSQSTFQTVSVCPALSPFLSCSGVVVVLESVADYKSAITGETTPTNSTTLNGGGSRSLMLLQFFYTPSIPIWPIHQSVVIGTAAYRNEF
jgi:Flp pilus assembly protein TadG